MIRDIKMRARESLKGKWGVSIAATLFYSFVCFIVLALCEILKQKFSLNLFDSDIFNGDLEIQKKLDFKLINIIVNFVYMLIFQLMSMGFASFFIDIARNKDAKIEKVLDGFSALKRNFCLSLIIEIITTLLGIIIAVVAIAVIFFAVLLNVPAYVLVAFLIIVFAATLIPVFYMLRMISFVAADEPHISAIEVVSKSVKMMKGKKFQLFLFDLSFLGWYILSILTFGMGFIFITPYVETSLALFYDDAALERNSEQALGSLDGASQFPADELYYPEKDRADFDSFSLASNMKNSADDFYVNPYAQNLNTSGDDKNEWHKGDNPQNSEEAPYESSSGNADIAENDSPAGKVCLKCGNINPAASLYCNRCGSKL